MRVFGLVLCCIAAVAQEPPPDPLHDVVNAYVQALLEGRFEEAATNRQEARKRLESLPVDSPMFPGWVASVASLYSGARRNVEAREVVQSAIARSAALGDGHPNRRQLLEQAANLWQLNGYLLESVAALEKLMAMKKSTAPTPQPQFHAVA